MILTFFLTTALYATWFLFGVRWLARHPDTAKSIFELLVRVFGPNPEVPHDGG